ncbi:unnamed protein product [Adineta steineri]|uniref:Uncharacterized protein n=1 Tax=Adineta steineri TaxID=433720 RepID=A0A814FHV9_9BILA|nr:unnamed protein product [Adineta steineri]
MAHITNGHTTNKINRIQDDEKELLFQLREIYASDYRKYSEHIRRESNIPLSIKKIYKLLDERKAYRRISDYFHRTRRTTKARSSRCKDRHKSYYRSTARHISPETESMSVIQRINRMDDGEDDDDDDDDDISNHHHQQSDNSNMLNDSDEISDTIHTRNVYKQQQQQQQQQQQIQPSSSSISPKHQQSTITSTSSKPNLLSIRSNIEKALRELDRAIISKSDTIMEVFDNEQQQQQQSLTEKINYLSTGHSNLDDIVRSLSTVVSQEQENTRLLIQESSSLLDDDNDRTEQILTQQSIKQVIERLNALVDRGHSIYDRVESILSEF